jgi:hypothetical protein
MGYTTTFEGKLTFTQTPTVEHLRALKAMIGEDARDHPDWGDVPASFNYIDLDLTDELDGLQWSGAEKSYGMVDQVNFVLRRMRKEWPAFGLTGAMAAQGEEAEDAWTLAIVDGTAVRQPRVLPGTRVRCPECKHAFRVTEDGKVVK